MIGQDEIMGIMQQMLLVCIKIAGPILIISILVGLIIAVFQAVTQIHEQTLTFVPKLLAIAVLLLVMSSWIYNNMKGFFDSVLTMMANA